MGGKFQSRKIKSMEWVGQVASRYGRGLAVSGTSLTRNSRRRCDENPELLNQDIFECFRNGELLPVVCVHGDGRNEVAGLGLWGEVLLVSEKV